MIVSMLVYRNGFGLKGSVGLRLHGKRGAFGEDVALNSGLSVLSAQRP